MRNTTFRIGDNIEIVLSADDSNYAGLIGHIAKIVATDETDCPFKVEVLPGGPSSCVGQTFWCREVKRPGHSKARKFIAKPFKFALQYELSSDPTEYFCSMKEVNKRIAEISEKHDLKRDKIFVHTISKTQKVELGVSIKLRLQK